MTGLERAGAGSAVAITLTAPRELHGPLAVTAPCPILFRGHLYRSAAQAYRAAMLLHPSVADRAGTGTIRVRPVWWSRRRAAPLCPGWERERVYVMHAILRAKFAQHPHLRALLLRTGSATLVDTSTRDGFWSPGPDGYGLNMAGRLSEVRSEFADPDGLRAIATVAAAVPQDLATRRWVLFGDRTLVVLAAGRRRSRPATSGLARRPQPPAAAALRVLRAARHADPDSVVRTRLGVRIGLRSGSVVFLTGDPASALPRRLAAAGSSGVAHVHDPAWPDPVPDPGRDPSPGPGPDLSHHPLPSSGGFVAAHAH